MEEEIVKEEVDAEDSGELTVEEEKKARLKAVYQARMILIRAGSPSEKMACSKAMRKMEKKYCLTPIPKSDKRRNKKVNKKLRSM